MLVLAVAGLIFLMIFIALPALQRAQRDNSRKQYITRVASEVINYYSNNRKFPKEFSGKVKDKDFPLKGLEENSEIETIHFVDYRDRSYGVVGGTHPWMYHVDNGRPNIIKVFLGGQCAKGENNSWPAYGYTWHKNQSNKFAIFGYLETGAVHEREKSNLGPEAVYSNYCETFSV